MDAGLILRSFSAVSPVIHTEGRPLGDAAHLLPHKRGENLAALVPEKRPDQPEAVYDFVGIHAFAFPVGRPFFLWLDFHRFAASVHHELFYRLGA